MITDSVAPETIHAWALCLRASEEARRRGDRRAGTEHLLLALLAAPSVEIAVGVSRSQARVALTALDQDALDAVGLTVGIDVPETPIRAVPEKPTLRYLMTHDRIRLTPAAKKLLEAAAKPNRRKLQVTAQQVLDQIALLRPPDPAAVLLGALGIDPTDLRSSAGSGGDA